MSKGWAYSLTISLLLTGAMLFAQSSTYGQNPPYSQNSQPNPQYGAVQDNTIPEGTRFIIRLDDTLDTAKLKPGKKFQAKLSEDLTAPDGSVIPAGKKVKEHVSRVARAPAGELRRNRNAAWVAPADRDGHRRTRRTRHQAGNRLGRRDPETRRGQ